MFTTMLQNGLEKFGNEILANNIASNELLYENVKIRYVLFSNVGRRNKFET